MKKWLGALVLVFFVFGFTATAYPWGSATHAYIIDLMKISGSPARQVYGAMAPDVFNYYFENITLRDQLYALTHYSSFMDVWNVAKGGSDRPAALGFVSHNNVWGIDYTAHEHSLTLGGAGYVIQKAEALYYGGLWELLWDLGVTDPAVGVAICHDVVETAIDIMVKNLDPDIGKKLVGAAQTADRKMLDLLLRAYAADVTALVGDATQAQALIAGNNSGFQTAILSLGNALKLRAPDDLAAISAQMAALAYGAYGLTVDPGTVAQAIQAAISVCGADFIDELVATASFVKGKLAENSID